MSIAKTMLAQYWGRYLLVIASPSGEIEGVFRDPSGAFDILAWTHKGVTIVASELPSRLMTQFGPKQGLDWDAIGRLLSDPVFGSLTAPIGGMTSVPPGAIAIPQNGAFKLEQLWRPCKIVLDRVADLDFAERELRRRVDLCVSAHANGGGEILAEVSGGFDSSVVATALVRAGAPVAAWCHHAIPDRSGDERAFAAALGDHLGIAITENPRSNFQMSPEIVERSQFGPRPSGFALDPQYDEDTVALAKRFGATRLFTGFGGDGLFFLSPYAAIARDLFLRRGVDGLFSRDFGDLARWCRKSVWSMGRIALRARHPALALTAPRWTPRRATASRASVHPWLVGADELPPAKRRHIEEQVLVQVANGTSLRGEALDLVHPLLSQPVLEHCLQVPVDLHVAGGRDRALARRAFRDRLPLAIVERRSKGELGVYYSRAFVGGLAQTRKYLLEGRLAEKGLVVPSVLERTLDEGHLAHHGEVPLLLRTVAVEAWVRRWEAAHGI